jgi:hypothetical protein
MPTEEMRMPADFVTLTEIIDGPVAAIDRVYGFDRIRDLCRTAPRTVRRARTRLTAHPHPAGDRPAIAEGMLVLEGAVLVGAAVTAPTMREAIDLLIARLRHRMRCASEPRRVQPIGNLPASAA